MFYTYNLYSLYSLFEGSYSRPNARSYGPTDGSASMDLVGADPPRAVRKRRGAGTHTAHTWLRQSYLELAAMTLAVPRARRHVRLVLCDWGLPDLAEPAGQVVSELMTNAVAATLGVVGSRFGGRWSAGIPPVRLWLVTDGQQVLVQVWDGSERMPEPRDLDPESDHGRGLWLVEAFSEDWGAFRPAHASGKVTWAAVAKSW